MRALPALIPVLLALLVPTVGTVLAATAEAPPAAPSTPSTPSAASSAAPSPSPPADASIGAAAPAAAAAQLSAEATPLFSVTPAPRCEDPVTHKQEALCFWANSKSAGASLTLSRTRMVMINPEIVDTTRGIAHITADRGEENGQDVRNSRWVFTGHIRADMSDGQLRADMATVQIVDGRIVSIDAQGAPALFQRPASANHAPGDAEGNAADNAGAPAAPGAAAPGPAGKPGLADITVRGHADSITYDAMHDRVQFSGNSWFTDGCNELTSQLVTYDMQSQTVEAGAKPGSNSRVHGVIRNTRPGNPGSSTGCTADTGHS